MKLRVFKLLIMFFLVIFLTAFSLVKNGERKIDFNSINYLDSNFKFISEESVNKLLKQSDSISLKLIKRDLNLKSLERIINENAFIDSAEVSLRLDGQIGVEIVEKEPVFRVLNGNYYVDLNGNKIEVSKCDNESELKFLIVLTEQHEGNIEPADVYSKIEMHYPYRIRASFALQYCYVACGRFDGFISMTKDVFPEIAGSLIVSEAGGTFTNQNLKTQLQISDRIFIGGNELGYKKMKEIIN